jgi:hypothetical protein
MTGKMLTKSPAREGLFVSWTLYSTNRKAMIMGVVGLALGATVHAGPQTPCFTGHFPCEWRLVLLLDSVHESAE